MTFWTWADQHWIVFGFAVIMVAIGTYELLSGLGSGLKAKTTKDADE